MKRNLFRFLAVAALVATPLASAAAATIFTDNFSSGSTVNGLSVPGGTTNASFTSYDIASTKNATNLTAAGHFVLALGVGTISGGDEAQALFAATPVPLVYPDDYIECAVVFTDNGGSLLAGGPGSALWMGLFNSGGSAPVAGGLAASGLTSASGSGFATGNCANWQGYVAQVQSNGTARIITRPIQNGAGTTSANQDLVGNDAGNGFYNNPVGTVLVTIPTNNIVLASGSQYTLLLRITLSATGTLTISNSLYSGADRKSVV